MKKQEERRVAGLPEEMKRKLRSRQIAGRLEALRGEGLPGETGGTVPKRGEGVKEDG